MKNILFILLVSVQLYSCYPRSRKFNFDQHRMEISLCSSGTIKQFNIYGKEIVEEGPLHRISEIHAIGNGAQKVSLCDYNVGYDGEIPLNKILPCYQYEIRIPNYDVQSVIILYTDSQGKVERVVNKYSCQ